MFRQPARLLTLLLVLSTLPAVASGASITFNPTVWSVNDKVTVVGTDLRGKYPDRSLLCLAAEAAQDKLSCFGGYGDKNKVWEEDDYIARWDDTTIEFTVPAEAPPSGVIILFRSFDEQKCFGSAGCDDYAKERQTNLGTYRARPVIGSIVDDRNVPASGVLRKGQKYDIRGAIFGADRGYVEVGQSVQARTGRSYANWIKLAPEDIVAWGATSIRIVPSEDITLATGLKVHNGSAESNAYIFGADEMTTSTTAASSSLSATPNYTPPIARTFTDVPSNADYAEAVAWAKGAGFVSGYEDGTFRPDSPVNRAEYLKMVFAAAGSTAPAGAEAEATFTDLDTKAWYMPYVHAARAAGVVKGYPDGTFRPEQTVSFAEGLKMAYLALGVDAPDTGGEWYEPYLRHALGHGVLRDATVNVGVGMSRKDVAWMVWNLVASRGSPQARPNSSSSSLARSDSPLPRFGDGTFAVGKDIQPGTYRSLAAGGICYFERLSGFGGEIDDIIANGNASASVIVTIAPTDAGFKSARCGTWSQDLSPVTASRTSFGDGMFVVGSDIDAGTYRNDGGEGCYYERLSGFGHTVSDIIANENADAPVILRIDARDAGFKSSGCGTWTKQY